VSNELLVKIAEKARDQELLIHIHLAETEKENMDYVEHNKKRPVEKLAELEFLGPNVLAAHSVWLNDKDIKTLAEHDVKISHNPISNMKLAVGSAIQYQMLKAAGLTISLGTDGCASNNNLDMFESMKIATILQKFQTNDQTIMPCHEAFALATINGAKALGLDAGVIDEGKLADIILVDLRQPAMTPNHDLISNLVYSANGSIVTTTICDGKVLMHDRKVDGEEEVIEQCQKHAAELIK
jgi:5-methylthioadenosine/S-adenosylhomocysteine deaminase